MEEEERKRTPLLQLAAGPGLPGRDYNRSPRRLKGDVRNKMVWNRSRGSGPSTGILSSRSKKMEVLRQKEPVSMETEQLKALRMKLAVMCSALDKVQ